MGLFELIVGDVTIPTQVIKYNHSGGSANQTVVFTSN
jgi:hypothetical protein